MQRLLGLVPVLPILVVVWLAVGCKEKENETPPERIGFVYFTAEQETLRYIPGDSVSTGISVLVEDTEHEPMEGVTVDFLVRFPELGRVEVLDTVQGNVTDSAGRLNATYRGFPEPGLNTVIATAGGVLDSVTLICQEDVGPLGTLTLVVVPRTVSLAANDSVRVAARLANANGIGLPNVFLNLSVASGHYETWPLTDNSGHTQTYWHPDAVGVFLFTAQYQNLITVDSVAVTP